MPALGFKVNDKVMAYHGIVIYDAKVLKIDHGNGVHADNDSLPVTANTSYFVHYQGWHKKWDEWVAHDRVLAITPTNRQVQADTKVAAAQANARSKSSKRKKKIGTGGMDPGVARKSPFKKTKINAQTDTEQPRLEHETSARGDDDDDDQRARRVALQMPFSLKKQLVEDWKSVAHEPHQLVSLPRMPCVAQIIANYLETKRQPKKKGAEIVDEKEYKNIVSIMEGVQAYFDRALGSILLYRFERPQYQEIKAAHPDKPLSQIYGAEHLIRLFVRLPVLLANATIPERELSQIPPRLNDFLKYLQKHSSSLFLAEYKAMDTTDAPTTSVR